MTTFLFWNLNRKPLEKLVANLAVNYEVDLIMLAECQISPSILLEALNSDTIAEYHYVPGYVPGKIETFTRFPGQFLLSVEDEDRLTIRLLKLPGTTEILLAVTHLPGKLSWSGASQFANCFELAQTIKSVEERIGHSRTVLVGDLNMNPFESGVIAAAGLHGTMNRRLAEQETRVVQSKSYPFFYNPMWHLFSDGLSSPSGTYYYRSSEQEALFWNMFDQVLIRPHLLPLFDSRELKIITTDGENSFLTNQGLPDTDVASDHLPILFKLRL